MQCFAVFENELSCIFNVNLCLNFLLWSVHTSLFSPLNLIYIMFVYHSQPWLQKRQDILSTTQVAPLFYEFLANDFINANYAYKKWMICVFINESAIVYTSMFAKMYLDCIQKLFF